MRQGDLKLAAGRVPSKNTTTKNSKSSRTQTPPEIHIIIKPGDDGHLETACDDIPLMR